MTNGMTNKDIKFILVAFIIIGAIGFFVEPVLNNKAKGDKMGKDYEVLYEDTYQQLRELTQKYETLKEDMRIYQNSVSRRYKTHGVENSSLKAQITKLKKKCGELESTQTVEGEELLSLRKKHIKLEKKHEDIIYNLKRARDLFGRIIPKECS